MAITREEMASSENALRQLHDVEQISFQFVSENSLWNVWSTQLNV